MGNIITWGQAHWQEVVQIYLAIIGLASLVVKMTPTLKDDTVLLNIVKFIAKYLALNTNTPTEEERPK